MEIFRSRQGHPMLPQMQVAFRRPREAVDLMGSDPFITAVEGKNHGFWLRLPSVGGLTPLNQLSARAGGATTGSYSYKESRRWSALRPVYPGGSRVRARRAGQPTVSPVPPEQAGRRPVSDHLSFTTPLASEDSLA